MKIVKYDLSFWIKGDKSVDEAQQIFDTVKSKLTEVEFNIEKAINPMLKELTYPIEKYSQAYLASLVFTLNGEADLLFFKELFKFDTNVLRFLVTLAPDNVNKRRIRRSSRNKEAIKTDEAVSEEIKEIETKEEVLKVKETSETKVEEPVEVIEEKVEEVVSEPISEVVEHKSRNKVDLDTLDEKLDAILK